jgi:Glycosyl hydrolase family 26
MGLAQRPRHPVPRLVSALVSVLAVAGLLAASRADAAMYWGGTISGSVYGLTGDAPWNQTVQSRFVSDAGRPITMVNTGQSWATFDAATMNEAYASGAIPLVTMGLQGQTLQEIAAGGQDSQMRTWAKAAKAFGLPFLFRPWWEMNGDWYSWGRSPYFVAAWQRFHNIVEEVGATNVTWAWVPNTIWGESASNPAPYYPGSAYVDWVGMDAYNFGTNPLQSGSVWTNPEQTIGPTLAVLNQIAPGKPVCICEIASTEIGGNKATWITELLTTYLPGQPSIAAFLWFNNNIEASGGRYDWQIESSATAQKAFHEGMQNSAYLSSLPALTPLTKIPVPNAPVTAPAAPNLPTPKAGKPSRPTGQQGRIKILYVRLNPRKGIARLLLQIPRPGKVKLFGGNMQAQIRWDKTGPWSNSASLPVQKYLDSAGVIELKIGATGAALKELRRNGRTNVILKVRLANKNGSVLTNEKSLPLKKTE